MEHQLWHIVWFGRPDSKGLLEELVDFLMCGSLIERFGVASLTVLAVDSAITFGAISTQMAANLYILCHAISHLW